VSNYADWKNWDASHFGTTSSYQAAYFEAELGPWLGGPGKRVLELGFGNGALLAWLRASGHSPTGIELDSELLERARNAGIQVFSSMETMAAAQDLYDLAVAFDVIEHIPREELVDALQRIRAVLRPGGHLLVRFPNGDSPYGRRHQYGDLTHTTVIGTGAIKQMATLTGFKVISLRPPVLPRRGISAVRALKFALAARLRSAHGMLVGHLYFGEPLLLDPNLLAVLQTPGHGSP
jgi:SAM-dependent methyltransferase